jgi:hypothetical protein
MWDAYVKEVDDWLYSTQPNAGQALFKEVESKIMSELHNIIAERRNSEQRRRLLTHRYIDSYVEAHRRLDEQIRLHSKLGNKTVRSSTVRMNQHRALAGEEIPTQDANFTQLRVDLEHEHEVYHGSEDSTDRVYVYLAADNERVKEAFAQYLLGHSNISVMRVHTGDIIVHAKNTGEGFI